MVSEKQILQIKLPKIGNFQISKFRELNCETGGV